MEDKYKLLSAPELAGEDSFIRWVLHGENNPAWTQWQQSFHEGTSTIDEARYIVQLMSGSTTSAMDADGKTQLWNRINKDIAAGKRKRNFRKEYNIIRWSMVAAAAIALIVWVKFSSGVQNIIVDPGMTASITLPESSIVTANAGSRIRYNEKRFTLEREIKLEGEAFFNVSHGSKFTVITPQGSVTVVGTSFNVIARAGRFEVSCYTGKVKVEQGKNDQVEITGGQSCSAGRLNEKLQLKSIDPSLKTPDWTRGKFTFENQPLSLVFSELERQYDINVKLSPGIGELTYTGLFELGNLEEAVSLITWPRHLKAQISGKTVTISR